MQVSVCLGAILIPEYLDSILAILPLISLNTVQYIYHFNTYNNDTTRRVSSTGLFSHLHHEVLATDCPFRQYLGSER